MTGGVLLSGMVALWLARMSWSRGRRAVAGGWSLVAVVLPSSAVIDATNVRADLLAHPLASIAGWPLSGFEFLLTAVILVVGGFILRQAWSDRRARLVLIVALASAVTNPLTEAAETWLISDPHNYTFVAADRPYRFTTHAARWLTRISSVQELSEDLSAIALLIGLLIVARGTPYVPDQSAASTSDQQCLGSSSEKPKRR
jgi:hypothetical protein